MQGNPKHWLLSLSAALLLAAGCATQQTRSFNQDFGENFPASPNYTIKNLGDDHFKIWVYQGVPLQGPQRVIYMKEAAQTIADAEGKRRGWVRWDLNYTMDRDQGWMRVMVADVVRKK